MNSRYPVLSILSLAIASVIYFGAVPMLCARMDAEIARTEFRSEGKRESTEKLSGAAFFVLSFVGGLAGPFLGLFLALAAQFRGERFPVIQRLAIAVNFWFPLCLFYPR